MKRVERETGLVQTLTFSTNHSHLSTISYYTYIYIYKTFLSSHSFTPYSNSTSLQFNFQSFFQKQFSIGFLLFLFPSAPSNSDMAYRSNSKLIRLLTTLLIFFLVMICCCKSTADAARPLNDSNRSRPAATTDTVMINSANYGKLGGIYGTLVMNALPKGTTPASGPSRRHNDINV